jgi:hypothetical protein
MKPGMKNWIWFLGLMALIIGVGIWVGNHRRTELGHSFDYSLDDYRKVDPALIQYRELEPLIPSLTNLTALAISEEGLLYVGGANGIQIIGGKTIPLPGMPTCLAVDEDGTLFVGMQNHVRVISKDGTTADWDPPAEKAYLTSMAADISYVYVADAGSRRVWRYAKGGGGEPLEIGEKDAVHGVRGFNVPSPFFDLAISRADGSIWVVNPGFHALENFRPDGLPLSHWEVTGMTVEGFSGCCNPAHFALLPDGGFVTAEKGLPRVKIHAVDGSLRCVVAAPDQFDDDASGLDIAAGVDGKIYVLDPGRGQVRIFEEIK